MPLIKRPNNSIIESLGFFATTDIPQSWYKVAGLPVFLAAVAVFIWLVGRTAELKHGTKPWQWFAVFPIGVAIWLGWLPFSRMRDFLYRDAIQVYGTRLQIAHYAAFLVPVACMGGLVLFEILERRAARKAEER